ncbi:hypothetical protein [Butyrivibrio sp. VCB2001]|uniref:hypothetical protein n=1 Tax=Butyrivibrio sp. VCB2001 TaxID=1280667 RepID=UPI0003F71B35|nr:hypothetical protein [Butyrivibrio sp. VCB2001]
MSDDFITKGIGNRAKEGFFTSKKIAVFGINGFSDAIISALSQHNYEVDAFLVNNPDSARFGHGWIRAYTPQEYLWPFSRDVVIVICSRYHMEMIEQLHSLRYEDSQVLDLTPEGQDICRDSQDSMNNAMRAVQKGFVMYSLLLNGRASDTTVFVCPNKGTGDVYLACGLLGEYFKDNGVKRYIITVVNNACRKVVELFGYGNIKVISQEENDTLLFAWEFLGSEMMDVKPMLFYGWRTYKHYLIREKSKLTVDDIFQYDVFEFGSRREYAHPLSKNEEYIKREFASKGLIPGKTIILSPYAGFFKSCIETSVWEQLTERFIESGYTVATNSSGDNEPVIRGSVPVFFPYTCAERFLEYAGGFIALRSGLCDIVSRAKCRIVIVYEKKNNMAPMHTFSIKRMGLNTDVEELEHFENDEELLEDIWKLWDKMK